MLFMNRCLHFHIRSPHPTPSLLLRKQYLSLREQCLSQRERSLAVELSTAPRACLQFEFPSPAGRSPQRGRDGEGVDNAAYEMKFRFFNRLLPSPQPLSHRERG